MSVIIETMYISIKESKKICWFYGLIVCLANLVGSSLPSTFSPSMTQDSSFFVSWQGFLANNHISVTVVSVMTFLIPVFLCMYYMRCKTEEQHMGHFINLPFAYAIRGITGWLFYFFAEIVFLCMAKKQFNIQIFPIISISFIYMILEGLFSFTIAYFVLETIHRKYVLPKYFSEGKLQQFKGIKNVSIQGVFTIFYVSTGIFPIVYVFFALVTEINNNHHTMDKNFLILFIAILIVSILITVIFGKFVSVPLDKLREGTEKITNGEYGHKVQFVSNDSFGILADAFNDMSVSLKEQSEKVAAMQNSIIKGMATMVESRDNSTGGHIMRTSSCVLIFADQLKRNEIYRKYSDKFFDDVIKAAPMHDLGKIAVDDAVLRKPGKFTDEEYEKMKSHSAEGARIVESVLKETNDEEFKAIAVNVAHYHHEKWDGNGYPQKLRGEEIPFEARIMALADVFDALVSKRCYKEPMSYDTAFKIIEDSLGSHFDPALGREFLNCRPQLEKLYDEFVQKES